MNGLQASLVHLRAIAGACGTGAVDVLICPPATLLIPAAQILGQGGVMLGGQDCHAATSGAHTGDLSAQMLADAGARAVILGHSERRADHGERSSDVRDKAAAAQAADMIAVICIGESLAERDAGKTLDIIGAQLSASLPADSTADNTVIAYEPVWAIGTGRTPTIRQIGEAHDFIRAQLAARFGADSANAMRLLYGGSVKASNAAGIFAVANVDGALVGGASLTAADFSPIVTTLAAAD